MNKKLPKNWVECSLGEIAEWGSGGTPNRGIPSYYNGTIPWLKTGDLNDGLITEVKEYITELGLKNSSAKIFPKNSVVIAMYGATIGKTGVLNFDSSTNQACAVAVPYFNMNKFIYLFLKSEKENFIEKGKGGAQPNISQAVIKSHKINLPPLPEQNRIVEKLDNMFNQLETIKASMANIPLLLKDFRQQVLSQAVTGKLTEERRKGKDLEEWDYKKIKKITFKVGSGSTPTGGQAAYLNEGIPLIRSMNVHFNGIKYDGLAYLNDNQAKGLKNVEVFENDILLNITGASIGRVCLAPKDMNGARVNQHVCIIRVNNELKPSFLNIYLSSPIIQNIINNENYGVTRQSFTKAQILELQIPIPSMDEQNIILSRVESLFAKADAIEQQYKSLKEKIDNLPQALLHKAFKGELTEQLGTDGDAKELLKAIANLKNIKVSKPKACKAPKEKLRLVAEPK
jgi:type I restriction enzyme, S subunit